MLAEFSGFGSYPEARSNSVELRLRLLELLKASLDVLGASSGVLERDKDVVELLLREVGDKFGKIAMENILLFLL